MSGGTTTREQNEQFYGNNILYMVSLRSKRFRGKFRCFSRAKVGAAKTLKFATETLATQASTWFDNDTIDVMK